MGQWLEAYKGYVPRYKLENLSGCAYWKNLLKSNLPNAFLDEYFDVPGNQFYLFYGAVGNGKRTLAMALAADLAECGYAFVHVPGDVFDADTDEQMTSYIRGFFQEVEAYCCSVRNTGLYVFFDDISMLCENRAAVWALARNIMRLSESNLPCVITATMDDSVQVPPALMKVMIPCPIGIPDYKERKAFLEVRFGKRIPLSPVLNVKMLAEMTEDFNYGMLAQFEKLSILHVKQQAMYLFPRDEERRQGAVLDGDVYLKKEMVEEIVNQLKQRPVKMASSPLHQSMEDLQQYVPIQNTGMVMSGFGLGASAVKAAEPEKKKQEDLTIDDWDSMSLDDL